MSQDDTELELQKIAHTFSSLVSKVQQCLERKETTVDQFVDHVDTVKGVESSVMYSQRSLYHASMDQIRVQKSVENIFPLISGYFSWFNHTPIEKMVEAFCRGDEEVRTTYRAFKGLFEEFCVNMVASCHKHGFGFERKKDAAKVVIKFDLMESIAKVNELVAIRNIVALHIKVKKQSLYLSSAECRVTTVATFLVPLFVAESAFPLTTDQESSLSQCGVLQIECGRYRYSSPAWSEERESRESSMGLADSMWYMSMMTVSSSKDLTGAKLEPILKKELAFLTGGVEGDRHQVVAVVESSLEKVDSPPGFEDFKTTLAYFKAIMKPEYVAAGATLVIDARDSKVHKQAKHLLEKIGMEEIPLPLHMIYVMIKSGFFGRKSLVSAEAATRLHLAYLHDPKQLAGDHLGAENVMEEWGGTLSYCHSMWLANRLQYEKIVHLHKKIMTRLPETKKGLSTFSVPSTVKDAEQLMQEELGMKEKMFNLFGDAELKMDQFLASLNDQQSHSPAAVDLQAMTSSVGEMLMEIKDSQNQFDEFWKVHRSRVEHMMRMCHFARSGEKLNTIMQGHIEDLAEDKAVLGDSLESALEQGEKHEAYATKCMETIDEQMSKIKKDASELCDPNYLPAETEAEMHASMQKAQQAVCSQLQELTKTYERLMTMCQQKRDLYIVCVKFHMNLRQLQQWNDETMELLASQPLEEPSPSAALNLLASIDQCQMGMTPTHVANLNELANTLAARNFKKKNDGVVKK